MTDMPERIWAVGNGKGGDWGSYNGLCHTSGGTEYVRADHIKDLEAKLAAVEKERDEWQSLAEAAIKDDAAKNIHYAEIQTNLVKLLEIGDAMAASIEGNYYIAGIAKKWREIAKIKGEQP